MHGSGDNQPNVQKSKIQSYSVEQCRYFLSLLNWCWDEYDSERFINILNAVYAEAMHWKMNFFKVPHGNVGKSFASELARLFKAFATGSALESIAMKVATLMPILLLQKPACKLKAKDHITCL